MSTYHHEETVSTLRELDDGTEIELTTLVVFTVETRHRRADEIVVADYDGDNGVDAQDKAHALTEDEKESVAIAADDAQRALRGELEGAAEAAAEDAWEASRDW